MNVAIVAAFSRGAPVASLYRCHFLQQPVLSCCHRRRSHIGDALASVTGAASELAHCSAASEKQATPSQLFYLDFSYLFIKNYS